MARISPNGIVSISRGDSVRIPLYINDGDILSPVQHALSASDRVYFYVVLPNRPLSESAVMKTYTSADADSDGDVAAFLTSDETARLNRPAYYYTARLDTGSSVRTFLPRTKLAVYGCDASAETDASGISSPSIPKADVGEDTDLDTLSKKVAEIETGYVKKSENTKVVSETSDDASSRYVDD